MYQKLDQLLKEKFAIFKLMFDKGLIVSNEYDLEKEPEDSLKRTYSDFLSEVESELNYLNPEVLKRLSFDLETMILNEYMELNSKPKLKETNRIKLSEPELRFKYILKKVNNTGNPKWGHYEKHWRLQMATEIVDFEKQWFDIPDVYFVEDESGNQKQITHKEYLEHLNQKR